LIISLAIRPNAASKAVTAACGSTSPNFSLSSNKCDAMTFPSLSTARLPNTTNDGIFNPTKNCAEALADQIKTALNDLSETVSEQEGHVEHVISDRPITSLASAFALGVVGLMLRRH
jgi:hypothetical protein